jgi:hypothetical protein
MVTTVEWIYIHLLAVGVSTISYLIMRAALGSVVAQINTKVIERTNADRDAQRKINLWLADKAGEALAAARAKQDSKVLPFRGGSDDRRP